MRKIIGVFLLIIAVMFSGCGVSNENNNRLNTETTPQSTSESTEAIDPNSLIGTWLCSSTDSSEPDWLIEFYSDGTYKEIFANSSNTFTYTGIYSLDGESLTRERDAGQLTSGPSTLKIKLYPSGKAFSMYLSSGEEKIFIKTE